MKKYNSLFFAFVLLGPAGSLQAQDTFSIVAVDPATGEVGSAGASCISATNLAIYYPGIDPDFLGDLVPGLGAINTQASYRAQNQQNARTRLLAGDTPQQVMDWLAANDEQGSSLQRQYGAAAFVDGQPQAAAFTGTFCQSYKGHRTGANYAIQGNILSGAPILDSMEARFLSASGCLSDRLMAALQGAKVPGADKRCLSNGTSAMFAFVKMAKPTDSIASPSLRLFVSYDPVGIEPIDSLQARYDAENPCAVSTGEAQKSLRFTLSPNPSGGTVTLWLPYPAAESFRLAVFDGTGNLLQSRAAVVSGEKIELGGAGIYFLQLQDTAGRTAVRRAVVR